MTGPGNGWNLWSSGCFQGPVLAPGCALLDPLFQDLDLFRCQRSVVLWRWHDLVEIIGCDAAEEFAVFNISRRQCCQGSLLRVHAKIGRPFFFVGAVAGEAVVGQDRLHIASEVDFAEASSCSRQNEANSDAEEAIEQIQRSKRFHRGKSI